MGAPKAWLDIAGEPMLTRVMRIASSSFSPVIVVSQFDQNLPRLPEDVEIAHDRVRNAGPLAGIAAGFEAVDGRCDAAIVMSCDHPLVESEVLLALVAHLDRHAAAIIGHEGRSYPLLGVYRTDAGRVARDLLESGERRARVLAERCGASVIDAADFAGDAGLRAVMNVNDQESLLAALKHLQ